MKNLCLILIGLLLVISLNGCLDFGEDEETTTPNKTQINRCVAEMYINPSIKINPLGYKLLGSGIDDSIWFKFNTESTDLSQIFDTTVVDVTKFKENFTFLSQPKDLDWWDVKGKSLLGGQLELPNVRFMNVGIDKTGDGYTIYIMWNEI